jgi:hypothetical protein
MIEGRERCNILQPRKVILHGAGKITPRRGTDHQLRSLKEFHIATMNILCDMIWPQHYLNSFDERIKQVISETRSFTLQVMQTEVIDQSA